MWIGSATPSGNLLAPPFEMLGSLCAIGPERGSGDVPGRLAKNIQYWVRKKEGDLQVGFKPGGFYGGFQELGTEKQPKIGALSAAVKDNINTIRDIEGKYLSAIEDEQEALHLISEEEYQGE